MTAGCTCDTVVARLSESGDSFVCEECGEWVLPETFKSGRPIRIKTESPEERDKAAVVLKEMGVNAMTAGQARQHARRLSVKEAKDLRKMHRIQSGKAQGPRHTKPKRRRKGRR